MRYLPRNLDLRAARQLIFIGEQNNVRAQLGPEDLRAYARLFARCHGSSVTTDSHEFLENYRDIVRLVGRSFPAPRVWHLPRRVRKIRAPAPLLPAGPGRR